MQPFHDRQRRGASLVIMLTTIAVGAVIVGLAVMVLIRVLALNNAAGEHLTRTVTVARLAEQFRADVAAARAAELTELVANQVASDELPKADADKQVAETDAGVAGAGKPVAPSRRLKLTLGEGHTITYDVHDGVVERTVDQAGQQKHSDRYAPAGLATRLPDLVTDTTNHKSRQFARLRLERRPLVESHLPQPPHSVVIEAQVGRDHRFSPQKALP